MTTDARSNASLLAIWASPIKRGVDESIMAAIIPPGGRKKTLAKK
tara:strand:- start:60 stop:194 length:135 start_codon:yes stop_codon:yes gene_type:complete